MLNSEFVRQVTVDRITDGIDLDRLEAICEAEKAGTLVILPCKVGDTVYVPIKKTGEVWETVIEQIVFLGAIKTAVNDAGMSFSFHAFGKTVFLTKEAAEKALERDRP